VEHVKKRLGKAGLRVVRRHPRGAWRVSAFVFRHWRFFADLYVGMRRLSRFGHGSKSAVRGAAVKAESKATVHDLLEVVERLRSVGGRQSVSDSRIADKLSGASRHASNAVAAANGTRDHRLHWGRTVAAAGVGVALLGVTAYWRRTPTA
jgi:hypothetical protein